MSDLIDRQAAIDILEVAINDDWEFDYAKDRMVELSTQPEIIYCGECKHMMPDGKCREFADRSIYPSASDFCSAAERKANGSD